MSACSTVVTGRGAHDIIIRMSPSPRHSTAEQFQTDIFRRMTPAQRVECSLRWTSLTCELARCAIRREHPHWTETEVDRELGRRITGIDVTTLDWERVRRQQEHLGRAEASPHNSVA